MEYGKMRLAELRKIARDKGFRRWTDLRRSALVRFLEDNDMFMELEQEITSLRQQQAAIPPLPPPPLRPTPYVMSQHKATTTTITSRNRWYNWLVGHTPKVKRNCVLGKIRL